MFFCVCQSDRDGATRSIVEFSAGERRLDAVRASDGRIPTQVIQTRHPRESGHSVQAARDQVDREVSGAAEENVRKKKKLREEKREVHNLVMSLSFNFF